MTPVVTRDWYGTTCIGTERTELSGRNCFPKRGIFMIYGMEVSKWNVDVHERVAGGIEKAKCGNPVGRNPGILESRRSRPIASRFRSKAMVRDSLTTPCAIRRRDQFDGRETTDRAIVNFVSIINSPNVTTEPLESAKHSHYLQMCKHEKVDKRYTRLDFGKLSSRITRTHEGVVPLFTRRQFGICAARMVIRTNEVKEATAAGVERGGDAGVAVRREFQFPGDLWLPRRENRCRQPPNNHTSYDYHTPGVYTRAPELNCVPVPRVKLCKVTSATRYSLVLYLLLPASRRGTVTRAGCADSHYGSIYGNEPSCTGIIQSKEHLRGFMPARNGDILSSRDLVLLGSPSRNFGLCKRSAYIKDQMSCYLDAINFEYLPENSHAAVTNLDVARLDYRNFRCFYTRNIRGKRLKLRKTL
ncbi:hypothetical protein ALC57_14027 [Trachymyrmex cornetzi]|uniref:Uncharacterized protein n=1 Tax=Trachymyrmex cornetzi TaxID=471704 RepID=A0A195DM41_9HYME|nr:hypothetical protein ALC57_14027 [Trachymyrmex cornetzi]